MALASLTTSPRRLSYRPTARLSPNARTSPMKPIKAPCRIPNGSRRWLERRPSRRPKARPTRVAPNMTTARLRSSTPVFSRKKIIDGFLRLAYAEVTAGPATCSSAQAGGRHVPPHRPMRMSSGCVREARASVRGGVEAGHADQLGRHAGDDRVGRDVLGHDRTSAHDRAVADSHAGDDRYAGSEPSLPADHDRCGNHVRPPVGVDPVVEGCQGAAV